jgi:tetratricopeptide (TPR) repeat protein
MSKRHPLLIDLQNALDARAWNEAERLAHEAMQLGLMRTRYGLPLPYLLKDLPNRRRLAADHAASELMAEAAALAQAGRHEAAQQRYEEAAALPDISPTLSEQIAEALAALQDQLDYGYVQDPEVERELEARMAGLISAIKEQQPDLARLMAACALPLWWDEPLLAAIRNRGDGREPVIAEKLCRFSFVYQWPDHYTFSRLARRLLLQQWDDNDDGFQEINERILQHLRRRLAEQPPADPAAYERLAAAHLHHTFLADPVAGVVLFGQLFQKAEDEYRLEAARQYVLVLKEAQPHIDPEYAPYIDYAEGWLHYLYRRETSALQIFRRLAQHKDLPEDLQARVLRGLGAVLVLQEHWAEAVQHYQQALALFEGQQNEVEAAETMVGLGGAYLSMATSASGRIDEFAPRPSRSWWLPRLAGFLGRLPLVLYLLWRLDLPWSWRAWQWLGEDMDWVVARLFSDAVLWFRQAELVYQELGQSIGLQRTQLALVQLYLDLNHYTAATATLRQVVVVPGSYQAACANLALAQALIGQRDETTAALLLHEALPIFVRLKHDRRIAQTQSWLGYLAAHAQKPDEAMTAYSEALAAWRRLDQSARATDVFYAMEALARRASLSPGAQALLDEAQKQTTTRVYESRFIHPVMASFQRLASLVLWLVVLLAVMTSVRSEAGSATGIEMAIRLPAQAESVELAPAGVTEMEVDSHPAGATRTEGDFIPEGPPQATVMEIFRPATTIASGQEAMLEIASQVTPELRTRFLWQTIAIALAGYLALYTVLGLFLIAATRIDEIQLQQDRWLEVDAHSIAAFDYEHMRSRLPWESVHTLLAKQRVLFGYLLEYISSVTLLGSGGEINITERTRHYLPLTRYELPKRLPNVRRVDTGFALPFGFFSWLLLASLLLLTLFIILVVARPQWVTQPLPLLPFAAMDLYGLLFLAACLPMFYGFVILPLRHQMIRTTNPTVVHLTALTSLTLAMAAWLQFARWHLPLGRPDLALGALSLILGGFVLYQQWVTARRRSVVGRIASPIFVAGVLACGLALWSMSLELRSSRTLALANAHFLQAEALSNQPAAASVAYQQALDLYSDTLALRPEPYIYNSQGNAYARLRRYGDAVGAYQRALDFDPANLTYRQNLALAYRQGAGAALNFALRKEQYDQALAQYHEVLERAGQSPQQCESLAEPVRSVRALRAATSFDLGVQHYTLSGAREDSFDYFSAALADYECLIAQHPDAPNGYIGKGLVLFYLREKPADDETRRNLLNEALEAFTLAIANDASNPQAYNGLSWVHWYLSSESSEGRCIHDNVDPGGQEDYAGPIEDAIEALSRGVGADAENALFFRTRGQLRYLLALCGPPDYQLSQLLKATGDYYIALSLEPRAEWYFTQGRLHLAAVQFLTGPEQENDAQASLLAASRSQLNAIRRDPNYGAARDELRLLYRMLNRSDDRALDDILAAMGRTQKNADLMALAQSETRRKTYGLAAVALERAVANNPQDGDAWLLLAHTMLAWGETYEDANRPARYARAIEAAQQALATGNQTADAYGVIARGYLKQGAYVEARQALASAPDPADVRFSFAPVVADAGLGDLANARVAFYFDRGLVHVGLEDEEEARYAFHAGVDAMRALRGQTARSERYARAIADLLAMGGESGLSTWLAFQLVDAALAAQTISATDAISYFAASETALAAGRHDQALPLLVQAIRLDPQNSAFWNPLRQALMTGFSISQSGSGEALLTIILGVTPSERAYETLVEVARSEVMRGYFGLAVAASERALALRPDGAAAALLKATAYQRWADAFADAAAPARYGASVEAAQLVETLLPARMGEAGETADGDGQLLKEAYQIQGRTHYQLQQWAESATAYGKAAALEPDEPSHYFAQGLAYVAQGDRARAEDAYAAGIEAALAVGPEVRNDRLEKALAGLRTVQTGAAALAGEFVALLEGVE